MGGGYWEEMGAWGMMKDEWKHGLDRSSDVQLELAAALSRDIHRCSNLDQINIFQGCYYTVDVFLHLSMKLTSQPVWFYSY